MGCHLKKRFFHQWRRSLNNKCQKKIINFFAYPQGKRK
jgi:hypothetical protein